MKYLRRVATALAVAFLVITTQPAAPADAFFEAYASYNGGTFRRAPDDQPLMRQQQTYVWCVASGTQAWIDYVRLVGGVNSRPQQSDMWWFFDQPNGSWPQGVNIDSITRGGGQTGWPLYPYTRRYHNVSQDDGADPYTAAWAIWYNAQNVGIANSYHINVYSTGSVKSGYDYAAHGIAYTLAEFQEPVGVIIGNGGHFVLVTYVQTDVSPLSNFWANITSFNYRDPLMYEGGYPYTSNKVTAFYSNWRTSGGNAFNEYGWNGDMSASYPNCNPGDSNCRDEARTGPYAFSAWWDRWVTIERDTGVGGNPDGILYQWW
jgi:hypothetical protein